MTKTSFAYAHLVARGLAILSISGLVGCQNVASPGASPAGVTTRQSALTVGSWSTVAAATPTTASRTIQLQLLSNGSVLLGDGMTSWWTLTPDNTGSYQNGTWSQVASSHFARWGVPSTLLLDGRYLIAGGEYTWGTSQANIDIYDPVADTWTEGPDMSEGISDTGSSILPDGTFYVSNPFDTNTNFFNPTTLTWTPGPPIGTGDNGDEKGWTLLQDGSVLDAFYTGSYFQAGVWTATKAIPTSLVSASSIEIGPMSLLYSGQVIQFGASDGPAPGNTAIYDPTNKAWTAGPSSPDGLLQWGDTSAVVMVNGHVLSAPTGSANGPSLPT